MLTLNPEHKTQVVHIKAADVLRACVEEQSPLGAKVPPEPSTLNPQPTTLNPQPSTLNPQPFALNPKP